MDQLIEVELERYKLFKKFQDEQEKELNVYRIDSFKKDESQPNTIYQEYYRHRPFEFTVDYQLLNQRFIKMTYCNVNELSKEELIQYRVYRQLKKLYDRENGNYRESCLNKQLGYVYIQALKILRKESPDEFERMKYIYSYIDSEIANYFFSKPLQRKVKLEEEMSADRIRVLEYRKLSEMCRQEELDSKLKNYYFKLMNILFHQITSKTLQDALLKEVNTINETKVIIFPRQYVKRSN